jgi:HIV-1 Vpr-binding protein
VLETHICHQSPITLLESSSQEIFTSVEFSGDSSGHLLLSSGSFDVRLWNSSTLGEVPLYSFDNCRAARFNTNGNMFAAISSVSPREVLLYNVESGKLEQKLSDISSSSGVLRGSAQCIPHFSPSDMLLLWNGVLWDHRLPRAVHRFEQFTDYGGGGFHPSGNEVDHVLLEH